MKKLSTNIITENGETKKITVFVEDETAAALAECDEGFANVRFDYYEVIEKN